MRKTGWIWLWVSVVVFLFDRITKELAQAHLTSYIPLPVMPSLNFTLAYNKGAAFSFLHTGSGWQVIFFASLAIFVVTLLLVWLRKLPAAVSWQAIGFTLIIGGALGNLWDRVCYGKVVDFIQLYYRHFYWPTFNIADSAICLGAVMLLIDQLRQKK